jgi:hypothetical protein
MGRADLRRIPGNKLPGYSQSSRWDARHAFQKLLPAKLAMELPAQHVCLIKIPEKRGDGAG